MIENTIKVINHLNSEIEDYTSLIEEIKNSNEMLKLNIQKKELYLEKLSLIENE